MTERTFSARLGCRYLLHLPEEIDARTRWWRRCTASAAMPEDMLRLTGRWWARATRSPPIEGPYGFFMGRGTDRGGLWLDHQSPHAESIRLHHEMVLPRSGRSGQANCGIPAERRVLLGFSQPVSLNYRFAEAHPDAVRGVVGICGGLPGDWDDAHPGRIGAAVLHIARRQDEFYPAERTEQYAPPFSSSL